jgi:hypothetical protein
MGPRRRRSRQTGLSNSRCEPIGLFVADAANERSPCLRVDSRNRSPDPASNMTRRTDNGDGGDGGACAPAEPDSRARDETAIAHGVHAYHRRSCRALSTATRRMQTRTWASCLWFVSVPSFLVSGIHTLALVPHQGVEGAGEVAVQQRLAISPLCPPCMVERFETVYDVLVEFR